MLHFSLQGLGHFLGERQPMATASLAGVRAKRDWAKKHFEQVNSIIKSLLGPEDYTQETAGHEFHSHNQQLIIRAKAPKPIRREFIACDWRLHS
jgi:hypothetical protein